MAPKKHDQPYFPLYIGDWRKAPEVRALDLDTRMVWLEMLLFMWESTERGYLTLNNHPIDHPGLARMLGLTEERLTFHLSNMEKYKVFSRRETDGAIYSKRMVCDEELRQKRANGGILGGNPALLKKSKLKKVKHVVNQEGYPLDKPSPDNENANENGISSTLKEKRSGEERAGKTELEVKLKEKQAAFIETMKPFETKYPKDLLNAFYRYWTEPNKSRTKLRWELEPAWELGRRLITWASRDKNFQKTLESRASGGGLEKLNYSNEKPPQE